MPGAYVKGLKSAGLVATLDFIFWYLTPDSTTAASNLSIALASTVGEVGFATTVKAGVGGACTPIVFSVSKSGTVAVFAATIFHPCIRNLLINALKRLFVL